MKTNSNNNQVSEIMSFIPFCKDVIITKLEDYAGKCVCACDLAFTLTENMNADGSFTYSTYKAKEYIKEWWDDCADFSDYEESEFGKRTNPFDNPESFTVRMVIEGVAALLSQCDFIKEKWDEEIKLTKRNISTIKKQIEELSDTEEVF